MMAHTTALTTQPATTPVTLEEESSSSSDGTAVAVTDVDEEIAILVDNSIVVVVEIDRAIEELAVLVDNSTVPVLGITEDNVTAIGKINTVGMISSYIMQYKLSITIK